MTIETDKLSREERRRLEALSQAITAVAMVDLNAGAVFGKTDVNALILDRAKKFDEWLINGEMDGKSTVQ